MPINENGFIEQVSLVAEKLDDITLAVGLFTQEAIDAMIVIPTLDIPTISADLEKGYYLGKRKIDINLDLNNLSEVTNVPYQQADILFDNGVWVNIPFYNIKGVPTSGIKELTSHIEIHDYIHTSPDYLTQVLNTELTVEPATLDTPEMIRFRDADALSSNVERIVLTVYGVNPQSPVEMQPTYFWADTSSAIHIVADKMDSIDELSQYTAELVNTILPNIDEILLADDNALIATIGANSANLSAGQAEDSNLESEDWANQAEDVLTREFNDTVASDRPAGSYSALHYSSKAEASAQVALVSKDNAEDSNLEAKDWASQLEDVFVRVFTDGIPSDLFNTYSALHHAAKAKGSEANALNSQFLAGDSASSAQFAEQTTLGYLNEITGLSATALTLVPGDAATASYDSFTGVLTLGIPEGLQGPTGNSYAIGGVGLVSEMVMYDNEPKGFSFLTTDETPPMVYFKRTNGSGDWTIGTPFGQGDPGIQGEQGLGWHYSNSVPLPALGRDGELHLHLSTYDISTKAGGVWSVTGSFGSFINDAVIGLTSGWSSEKILEELRVKANASEIFSDYVVTGLLPAGNPISLTSDISSGVAYITGLRTTANTTPNTYTASRDTYVDVLNDGTYVFSEVVNGGIVPPLTPLSLRVAAVITDGTGITSVTDMRLLDITIDGRNIRTDGIVLDALVNAGGLDDQTAVEVPYTPFGNLESTNVQDALNELENEKTDYAVFSADILAVQTSISDHVTDTVDAHAASAIGSIPVGNITATDVQAALNQLEANKAGSIVLSPSHDLDNVITSGFYYLNASPVNAPAGASYSQMIVSRSSNSIAQIVISYISNSFWIRSGNPVSIGGTGAWSAWSKMASENYVNSQNALQNININQNAADILAINNSDNYQERIGMVQNWISEIIPDTWLELNGGTIDSATHPKMQALIDILNPGGNTTAVLPDLRGEFVRGWSNDRLGVPDQDGRAILSNEAEDVGSHTHTYNHQPTPVAAGSGSTIRGYIGNSYPQTGAGGGAETRPRNVALPYIVKAFDPIPHPIGTVARYFTLLDPSDFEHWVLTTPIIPAQTNFLINLRYARPLILGTTGAFVFAGDIATGSWIGLTNLGNPVFYWDGVQILFHPTSVYTGSEHKVTFERDGNDFHITVDDNVVSINTDPGPAIFTITKIASNVTNHLSGYVSDIEIKSAGDLLADLPVDESYIGSQEFIRDRKNNFNGINQSIDDSNTEEFTLNDSVVPNQWENWDLSIVIPIAGTGVITAFGPGFGPGFD